MPDDLIGRFPVIGEFERGQMLPVHPLGISVYGCKRLGGLFGKPVDRNAVFLKVFHTVRHVDDAHETAQNRLMGAAGDPNDGFCGPQHVGHGLGG